MIRGWCAAGLPWLTSALQLGEALNPDLMLVTGDLCQDESWGGYARLLLDLTPDRAVQHRVLRWSSI